MMSHSYFVKITNKSLKSGNFDPLEGTSKVKPTKIIVRNEEPVIAPPSPQLEVRIEENEFLSCMVKTFMDVVSNRKDQLERPVADFAYLTIHPQEEQILIDVIKSCSDPRYVDNLPYVNATHVVRGLRKQHKTLKFIDQNEMTAPPWARNVQLFKTFDVQTESTFSKHNNELIEIDQRQKKVIPIDHENQACFEHNGDFWNDIKNTLDDDQKKSCEKDISDLSKKFDYIQTSDSLTYQEDYHDNKAKPWNQNNYAVLSMNKKNDDIERQDNSCFWLKLTNAITENMYSQNENKPLFPMAVRNLINYYFSVTGKKAIDIYKNFNILFSVHKKRICQEIQRINKMHVSCRKKTDCSICKQSFDSPFFPYILLYCMLACKKNMFSPRNAADYAVV